MKRLARTVSARQGGRGAAMRRPRTGLLLGLAVVVIGFFLSLGSPEPALAGEPLHEVTWAHGAASQVRHFVIFVSEVDGDIDIARAIDVGKPIGRASGTIQFFSAIIPAEFDDYVAIAAVAADGSLSPLSAWTGLPPSQPGQPVVVP